MYREERADYAGITSVCARHPRDLALRRTYDHCGELLVICVTFYRTRRCTEWDAGRDRYLVTGDEVVVPAGSPGGGVALLLPGRHSARVDPGREHHTPHDHMGFPPGRSLVFGQREPLPVGIDGAVELTSTLRAGSTAVTLSTAAWSGSAGRPLAHKARRIPPPTATPWWPTGPPRERTAPRMDLQTTRGARDD